MAQLDLVKLLRAAMNGGTDPGGIHVGPAGGPGSSGCPPETANGPAGNCSPEYCPRPVIHPEPRYLPRQEIRPQPYYAPVPWPTREAPEAPHGGPKSGVATSPSIEAAPQPPWKVLPWQQPAKIPPKIKIVVREPDILHRGNLIDLFC